jgi:YD repeat-containing protein
MPPPTPIAQYSYDTNGRLAAEWDPRIAPALKEQYSYDTAGNLTSVTPPGEERWTLSYAQAAPPPAQPGDPLPGGDPPPIVPPQGDPPPPPAQPGDPLPSGDPPPIVPPQGDPPPPPAQPGDPLPGGDPPPIVPPQGDPPPPPAQPGDPLPGGDPPPVPDPNDPNAGRLLSASRPALPGTATTTVVYNVPTSGTGAPYAMGSSDVAAWGQSPTEAPAAATAIFPPDQVPASQTPTDYSHATIHYLDTRGREVNQADPGARISTSEYDNHDNVVRELTAANRDRALSGASPASRAVQIDTRRQYNTPDGTLLVDEIGPLHSVKLASGETVDARAHTHITYDEGAPTTGGPYGLPTTTTRSAQIAGRSDADTRTKTTTYDWTLRLPTSETVDPGGLNLTTTTTYDSVGNVTAVRLPANPNGGDAHEKVTVYYSADAPAGADPVCVNKPEWAGLPCKDKPGRQPGTAGLPDLPVATYTYNRLNQPLTAMETTGTATRTTTLGYDNAGRRTSKVVTASEGYAVPTQTIGYDAATGLEATKTVQYPGGASAWSPRRTTPSAGSRAIQMRTGTYRQRPTTSMVGPRLSTTGRAPRLTATTRSRAT